MKQIVSSWRILVNMLREIFDEAAYVRFLDRRGITSSSEAYSAFRVADLDRQVRNTILGCPPFPR